MYYVRQLMKRVPVNRFGKLGYRLYYEVVKTNNIEEYNYRKRIKFIPLVEYAIYSSSGSYIPYSEVLLKQSVIDSDYVYEISEHELLDLSYQYEMERKDD